MADLLFEHGARVNLLTELLLERGVSRGRCGQVGGGALLSVLRDSPGLGQSPLDRGTGSDGLCQRCAQFRLARRQAFGRGGEFRLPVSSGLLKGRSRIGQLPFDRRGLPNRGGVLRLDIGETRGRRRQLACVLLVRIVASSLGGDQLLFEPGARVNLLTELLLERGVSLGSRGQVRGGTLLRIVIDSLGLGQSVLGRSAGGNGFRQRPAQFRFPQRQPIRRGGKFRLPVASGLLERGNRTRQLPFNGRDLLDRRGVLRLDIGETHGRQRQNSVACCWSASWRAVSAAAASCSSNVMRAFDLLTESLLEEPGRIARPPRPGRLPHAWRRADAQLQLQANPFSAAVRAAIASANAPVNSVSRNANRSAAAVSCRLPVSSGLLKDRSRIGQLAFDRRGLLNRGGVLRLDIGESRGRRRQLGCVLLVRIVASSLGGGRSCSSNVMRAFDLAAESHLERGVSLGSRGQVRGSTLLRIVIDSLGLGQSVLGRSAGGDGVCQRPRSIPFPATPIVPPRRQVPTAGRVGLARVRRPHQSIAARPRRSVPWRLRAASGHRRNGWSLPPAPSPAGVRRSGGRSRRRPVAVRAWSARRCLDGVAPRARRIAQLPRPGPQPRAAEHRDRQPRPRPICSRPQCGRRRLLPTMRPVPFRATPADRRSPCPPRDARRQYGLPFRAPIVDPGAPCRFCWCAPTTNGVAPRHPRGAW